MRNTVRVLQRWFQRVTERHLDKLERLQNQRWWTQHEHRVYQLVVGLLPTQSTFPVAGTDIVNQAVIIVRDIERRKADGQVFVKRAWTRREGEDHAETAE